MTSLTRIYHGSFMARVCLIIIALEVLLLTFLYFVHGFKILIQYIYAPYRKRRLERFSNSIESLLFESTSTQIKISLFPKHRFFEKSFLREILLTYIVGIKGDAKKSLFVIYCELGFFKMDTAQCRSKKWWRRLSAAVRLQQLGVKESDQVLRNLINDPYPFIADMTLMHFRQSEKKTW